MLWNSSHNLAGTNLLEAHWIPKQYRRRITCQRLYVRLPLFETFYYIVKYNIHSLNKYDSLTKSVNSKTNSMSHTAFLAIKFMIISASPIILFMNHWKFGLKPCSSDIHRNLGIGVFPIVKKENCLFLIFIANIVLKTRAFVAINFIELCYLLEKYFFMPHS